MRRDEYMALREKGMTYAAIAKLYGCSRQNVEQVCNRRRKRVHPKLCVYDGLRSWMDENQLSLSGLYRRMCGENVSSITEATFRTRLKGTTKWQLEEINLLLDVTGLTYEQLFRKEPGKMSA